ncbi:hypothetical protein [Micromonospora aurantiaca (nom. illeg.)]|uniref:hypothetical protein n=1 Tax=Micromonospora aurantiaca (nom. illeg.) TaxID=47850 RepID=UPI0033F7EA3E
MNLPPRPPTPLGAMTDPGADWLLAQLREVLDLTSRAALRRLDPAFWQPRPGSVFAAELANTEVDVHGAPWGPQEPTMAFEMAQLSLVAVEDFLTAIRKLLEPPFPPYVPKYGAAALCRSVLESAANAFWLADPRLTVRQRVARVYLVLWDEHNTAVKNATKALAAKALTAQEVATARADRDALLTRIDDLGLGYTKKPRTVGGEALPTKTEKVTALLAGEVRAVHDVVYSLYSGFAHGDMTSILASRLGTGWTITPRQLTQDVEMAVAAVGILQERLCLGGMGSSPREAANWFWQHNAGRRLRAVRDRLA